MSDPLRQPLVLLVDDTPANLRVLFDLLSDRGFQVAVAEDGESALEQLEYIHPDLILLDVLMPVMDGYTACRRLKERPETRDIPVVFMSALTDTADKVKGFECGAVDYITKPFQHEEVLARIRTHIALQRLKQRVAESEERLASVIQSALDAIIAFDADGCITLFNRAAERVFRCPATAAIGTPCAERLSPDLWRLVSEYVARAPPAPIRIPEGHRALRADGSAFPIEASLSSAPVTGGATFTLFLRDIEARKYAESECRRLEGLTLYLQEQLEAAGDDADLVGGSQGLQAVMEQVRQVATTDATVLITGETGTGKGLIARAIHASSRRKDAVLVKLNCAAIPEPLVESELFGHEKGAFTGALARKLGRFELADWGTLFMDEVGELPIALQPKLLRVLQDGELERVGGTETRTVNVRIIAATNRDLVRSVHEGRFRADLYYRLNVFPIALPALRARRDDLPALVGHFVRRFAERYGKPLETVSPAFMAALEAHDWPGNVRELEHVIERAVILSRGTELTFNKALSAPIQEGDPEPETMAEAERAHILRVLEAARWRVAGPNGAALRLGLRPTTLESRMKKLGIRRPG